MRSKIRRFVAEMPNPQANKNEEQFWEFKNEGENSDEVTLYIYGDIVRYDFGNWNFPDDVVPNKFKEELRAVGDVGTIHLRINSNGGSVFAAYAIRSMLKSHKAKVIAYNDGLCASAATIVATAADKVISAIGALWLYHVPSMTIYGTYKAEDFKKMIKELETITSSMIEIYQTKTGMDKKELEAFLKEDVFISGTDAMEKGFVDEVSDIEAVAYLSEDKGTAFFNNMPVDISRFKNREEIEKLLPVRAANGGEPKSTRPTIASIATPAEPKAVKPQNENDEEETILDLNELKAKYPDIYNSAKQEGYQEGVTAERDRIKSIEDISLPGMETIATKAKFESGVTSSEFAIDMVKAQKEKGLEYFKDAQTDAKNLDEVPGDPAPEPGADADAAKKADLLATAEDVGKSIRG